MRPDIKELYQKTFQNDVYIVGGGPSLRGFDFSRLDDKVTVGLNSAYTKLPNATALYWADETWAATNYDSLQRHQCKLRFSARFHLPENMLQRKGTAGCTYLRRSGDIGFDTNPDNVMGTHSGAHAINLVANLRPKRIILLGYDMRETPQHTHWHDFYPVHNPVGKHMYRDGFIPCIVAMKKPLEDLGIEVVNCSMESALLCFEKDTIDNYLD